MRNALFAACLVCVAIAVAATITDLRGPAVAFALASLIAGAFASRGRS